jgi:tRNA acetyltransferase TAN1
MTLIGKATTKGLDELAKSVLAPHFHGSDQVGKRVGVRPAALRVAKTWIHTLLNTAVADIQLRVWYSLRFAQTYGTTIL